MYYIQDTILGNSYAVTTDYISIQSTETRAILIKNPLGNTKPILVSQVAIGSNASIVIEGRNFLKAYLDPSPSDNGTLLSAQNMKCGSPNIAAGEIYKNPTVADDSKGLHTVTRTFVFKGSSDSVKQVICIDPGHSVLVTCEGSVANNVHFDINWLEPT
jgi:hypothetical protein